MVLLRGTSTEQQLLYDVSNPIHPRLLCSMENTSAHLFTGDTFEWLKPISANETDVVLHSLGSGNDSLAGTFPFQVTSGSWLPDRTVMAYTAQVPPDDANFPAGGVAVYLYAHQQTGHLFTYSIAATDCICRFGLPPQVLAVSPDGQYVVAGWVAGKGSEPLAVYRVSDRTMVTFLDPSVMWAYWDRSGHRLFLDRFGTDATESWTPEMGVSSLTGPGAWTYLPGLSPDGSQVAFTAYADPNQTTQPRVYVHDLTAATTRMLVDKLRTQALFVKDGWVWYLEEALCDPASCGAPWGTVPTGRVFAMQLSAGTETEVSFAAGENPLTQGGAVNWLSFGPGEFWPAS
jgi:hypothetical protein